MALSHSSFAALFAIAAVGFLLAVLFVVYRTRHKRDD